MRYIELLERNHDYPTVGPDTQFEPIVRGDSVKVYHGFRDFPHAVELARYGLSGKVRAARIYSYESDNNPYGLFVTLSRKVAEGFVGAHGIQAIVEFDAHTDELEAPVWPGGSYTVQGQYSQYFGRGASGRAARKQQARTATDAVDVSLPHIKNSDDKLLADLMTNSREHQALFVGHLDPQRITAWWVRAHYSEPYERITPDEFIKRYGETPLSQDSRADDKIFTPGESFSGEKFISGLAKRFGGGGAEKEEYFRGFVRDAWVRIIEAGQSQRTPLFLEYYGAFLWPKQYIPAMQWMRANQNLTESWERDSAANFLRGAQPYFDDELIIVGSVKNNGRSDNDLDILITGEHHEGIVQTIMSAMTEMGMVEISDPVESAHHDDQWFIGGSLGGKVVEFYFHLDL